MRSDGWPWAEAAFSRAGDAQCARCSGLVYDWAAADVNEELTARDGWCSWCGEKCGHLVRDARREYCQCLVCGGGTAPCDRCPGVMRRRSRPTAAGGGSLGRAINTFFAGATAGRSAAGGMVSSRGCMRCEVRAATPRDEAEAVWEAIESRRAAAEHAAPRVIDQLARQSRHSDRAHRAGLSRPFMLLATLPPRERVRLGMRLGISLARRPGYLDPHAEAWTLLTAPRKGVCARAENAGAAAAAAEAAGVKSRANWLEVLALALVAGAETGGCPALDPREAANLPRVRGRSRAEAASRTPRAVLVAKYEETALRLIGAAQSARLTSAQRVTADAIARHPRMRELEARLTAAGTDPRGMARVAVVAAFAASAWAAPHEAPLDPRDVDAASADVFGLLLEGRRPTGPEASAAGSVGGDKYTDEGSGIAPSLLSALASVSMLAGNGAALAQLVPEKYAVLTPADFLDNSLGMRPPAETAKGPSGLFEPLAVLLMHNVLLAARGLHVDDYRPRGGTGNGDAGKGRVGGRSTSSAGQSPVGVIDGLGSSRAGSDHGAGSSLGDGFGSEFSAGARAARERVERWAAKDAAAAAEKMSAEAGVCVEFSRGVCASDIQTTARGEERSASGRKVEGALGAGDTTRLADDDDIARAAREVTDIVVNDADEDGYHLEEERETPPPPYVPPAQPPPPSHTPPSHHFSHETVSVVVPAHSSEEDGIHVSISAAFNQSEQPDRSAWSAGGGRLLVGEVPSPKQPLRELTGNADRFVPAVDVDGVDHGPADRQGATADLSGDDDGWPSTDEE